MFWLRVNSYTTDIWKCFPYLLAMPFISKFLERGCLSRKRGTLCLLHWPPFLQHFHPLRYFFTLSLILSANPAESTYSNLLSYAYIPVLPSVEHPVASFCPIWAIYKIVAFCKFVEIVASPWTIQEAYDFLSSKKQNSEAQVPIAGWFQNLASTVLEELHSP